MSIEEALLQAVAAAVRAEVEPLRAELAALRAERAEEGVSIDEAARRLNLSSRTVRRRLKDGTLSAVQIGGVRRVLLSGVLTSDPGTR